MMVQLGIDAAQFCAPQKYGNNNTREVFNLPKDLTLTLITGYSIPLRHKINQRWMELVDQMNNQITPFQFHSATIRTLEVDGEPMFVAKDVAVALGYARPDVAVATYCKGACKTRVPSAGGPQMMSVIPERDVYRLVMNSKVFVNPKYLLLVVTTTLFTCQFISERI